MKPERRALIETTKAVGPELYGAIKAIRDLTMQAEQPTQTRLNDIRDMADEVLRMIDNRVARNTKARGLSYIPENAEEAARALGGKLTGGWP